MSIHRTICPQCLLDTCIDCQESDCPGEAGMVPKKEGGAACMNGASMKILTTMGLRICELEDLLQRAGNLLALTTDNPNATFAAVIAEARRIAGKKTEAAL